MSVCYTRVNLKIEIKGYPVGGLLKLHFWMDGIKSKEETQQIIDEKIINNTEFADNYTINNLSIHGIHYTSTKSEKEGIDNIIFDSYVKHNIETVTKTVTKTVVQNEKPKKVTFKDINLFEIDNDGLKNQIKRIEEELFKRDYFFSDAEFDFYKEIKEIIDVMDVKKLFELYKGDALKFKKDRIREKLKTIH